MMNILKRIIFNFLMITAPLVLAVSFQSQAIAEQKTIIYARPSAGPIDPAGRWSDEGGQSMALVYNSLVMTDRKGNVIPDLAESWEVSPDYKEYTFHLRKGVKFHDGTPFNAQAVKFSYDRMLRVARTAIGNYRNYADQNSCTVVDDYTIKIILTKPFPIFLIDATCLSYAIISPEYVKKHATSDDPDAQKWMTDNAVGTGPFKLVEFKLGQRAVFEKFEDYWGGSEGGKTTSNVDRVIYQIVEDPSTARLMLEKGDVDIVENLAVEHFDKLRNAPGIKVVDYEIPVMVYITVDISKPPFNDINVRKAIAHAINYNEITTRIERGTAKRIAGIIPKGTLGYNPNLPRYEYDLAKAKELLKASGHSNGFSTDFIYSVERRREFEQVAIYIQAYLKKIGINANLQKLPFQTQLSKMEKGNYGMSLMRWGLVIPDPDDIAGWLYDHSRASGGWTGSYWDDKDVQAKLVKTREIADAEQRKALYQEVERKAVDQAIYTYLYQLTKQVAMRENIAGFYYDASAFSYFWTVDKK
jgi:peptide/nickel transport system substrate-binding protein